MREIHHVPLLAINWPCDSHGEVIGDGSENDRVRAVVHDYLSNGFNPSCRGMQHQLAEMKREYELRLQRYPMYAEPPRYSAQFLKSAEVIRNADGRSEAHLNNSSRGSGL